MPELPEVENIRLTLARNIVGQEIKEFKILWPDIFINCTNLDPNVLLIGKKVESVGRRGKYLLINFDGGATLILHFRMTGKLVYYEEEHEPDKHTHAVFYLEKGQLHHSDTRKFGRIQLIETALKDEVPAIAKLGPEPLDSLFTLEIFGQKLSSKKSNIKAALLDQEVIAGIGNIYADEALFRAGIRPDRKTKSLKVSEVILLYDAIQKVLKEGIEAGGTSFRDYRDGDGNKGLFQENLKVYGRAGLPCKICGSILEKTKIAGRTSVYCPVCQN
jgi:formamidopyrimidine-DNA glycosylase